jgi:hypothetical protein
MPTDSVLLDLADIDGWFRTTREIAGQLISDAVRAELKDFDPDEMYEDTMTYLVETSIRHGEYRNGECVEVDDWSADFDEAFRSRYSHIRGFHACRAFAGLDTYRRHGIRKLSRSLLREIAHVAFRDHATTNEIDMAVNGADIPDFEESVYLFTDASRPLDSSCSHYLKSGSEMLQALSITLGIHSRGILASQGEPFLIECHIPLEHVSKGFRWELWRKFITEYFCVMAGAAIPTESYDFCIRVTQPIAPSSIVGFHKINGMIRSIAPYH